MKVKTWVVPATSRTGDALRDGVHDDELSGLSWKGPSHQYVFTSGRVAVLEMLASQAAISLENARLNSALEQEHLERKRAEAELRQAQAELAHVTRVTTMGELAASIAHEVS